MSWIHEEKDKYLLLYVLKEKLSVKVEPLNPTFVAVSWNSIEAEELKIPSDVVQHWINGGKNNDDYEVDLTIFNKIYQNIKFNFLPKMRIEF